MRLLLGLMVVCATACNPILGIGDIRIVGDIDAGAVDSGPSDSGPSEVKGTAIDTYFDSPTTTKTRPQDLRGYTFAAYIADGKGGFQMIEGTPGTAEGTFTIPDVPAGGYYLSITSPGSPNAAFYYTMSHAPDIGFPRLGRINGPELTQATPIDLHLTGMTAAGTNDVFEVDSFADNATSFPENPGVQPGVTTIDLHEDWNALTFQRTLLQSGDDLWVLHYSQLSNTIAETSLVTSIVDTYSNSAVDLTDGQSTTVLGTFVATPQIALQMIEMTPSTFYQGLDITPDQPMAVRFVRRASFTAQPVLSTNGMLAVNETITEPQSFLFQAVSYGDPFPASWLRWTIDIETLGWTYVTRGSGLPIVYRSQSTVNRRMATDTVMIAPVTAAPHTIKVGGVLASSAAAIPFDGSKSIDISWASVVGSYHYVVKVLQLRADGGTASLAFVTTFDTSETQITMPPALFTIGSSYVISVSALQDGSVDYPGGMLRRAGFPTASREGVTARLLFAASCGNNVVDAAYEECDSGGVATTTCNPDCTKSRCGDGVANLVAGETCDTGRDTLGCDADCTPVMCGDGHVNAVAGELCDLGAQNGMPGQCCTAKCTLVAPATHCP